MREIKFRIWNTLTEKMIVNASVQFYSDGDIESGGYDTPDIKIMQYTGLKDTNGVEIYEDDVLKNHMFPDDENFAVQYIDGSWNYSYMLSEYGVEPKDLEVIGNTYETPELLDK